MQVPSDNRITYLVPQNGEVGKPIQHTLHRPFSHEVVMFLDAWSKMLLKKHESRAFPDVITFAFWCRKANLLKQKEVYRQQNAGENDTVRIGRGLVYHIAPSNVPINFAYSLVTGLLAGNANIVKVSSKEFRQVDILFDTLNVLLEEEQYREMKGLITIIKYDRTNKELTDWFSSICDVRIIWGGDTTIQEVRRSILPPRSFDICFADRYSLGVINAPEIINSTDLMKLAEGFYNDTYLFDQNACTSPHLLIWMGEEDEIDTAKNLFWHMVQEVVEKRYRLDAVIAVDKLTTFCKESIQYQDTIKRVSGETNAIVRITIDSIQSDLKEYRNLGGFFNEYSAGSLEEILPMIDQKVQTVAYFGLDKSMIHEFLSENSITGIDRIVPIGKTLDFELIWDGYDLISSLSRIITIR